MVSILLKNNNTEVIVSLIENMGELIKIVGGPSIEDKIIPAITTLAADKTWRIRLAAVQFFPKLALTVGRDLFQAKLQNVILGMLMDPVFTIRETALESLIEISKHSQTQEWLLSLMLPKLSEFSRHERFMIRIQAVHFVNKLATDATKDVLNKNLMETVLALGEDPVPNIRFNVCKTIDAFYPKMTPGNKIKSEQVLSKISSDADFDCQYFARQALAKVNKI
jgi:serine/threonine-protein phosphatase 2A regulatory subunit A